MPSRRKWSVRESGLRSSATTCARIASTRYAPDGRKGARPYDRLTIPYLPVAAIHPRSCPPHRGGEGAGCVAHPREARRVVHEREDVRRDQFGRRFGLRNKDGCAGIGEDAGILGRLIAAGTGEGDENGWFAERGEFGDGACARSPDDECRKGIDIRQFITESFDDDVAPRHSSGSASRTVSRRGNRHSPRSGPSRG